MGKKSRRDRAGGAANRAAPRAAGSSAGPNFSQVPQILHIVQSLASSGRVPREAVFYAMHHLLDLESKHASDPGFHALAQARVDQSDVTRFVQTSLQIMTSHHQQIAASKRSAAGEAGEAGDDDSGSGDEAGVEEAAGDDAGSGDEAGVEGAAGEGA